MISNSQPDAIYQRYWCCCFLWEIEVKYSDDAGDLSKEFRMLSKWVYRVGGSIEPGDKDVPYFDFGQDTDELHTLMDERDLLAGLGKDL